MASAANASASIAIGGDEAFKAHVRACFQLFKEDPQASAILRDLMRPQGPHSHKTTILPRPVANPNNPGPNFAQPTEPGAEGTPANPGTGANNEINWSPIARGVMGGGVLRDPCASLLHEMSHAAEMGSGTLDPGRFGTADGIPVTEVNACEAENEYRGNHGLPRRPGYNVERPPGSHHWVLVPLPSHRQVPVPGHADTPDGYGTGIAAIAVPGPLQLAVKVEGTLKLNAPIKLTMTLTNRSSRSMVLSNWLDGNVQIVAATRNRVRLKPARSFVVADASLFLTINASRKRVPPSRHLVIQGSTFPAPAARYQVFQTFVATNDPSPTSTFSFNATGTYRLTFVYQWAGSDAVGAYLRASNRATVTFTLRR